MATELLVHERSVNTWFDPDRSGFVYTYETRDGERHMVGMRGLTRLLKMAYWRDTRFAPRRRKNERGTGGIWGGILFDRQRTHALNCMNDGICTCGYLHPPRRVSNRVRTLLETAKQRGITLIRSEVPITSLIASFSTSIDAIGETESGGLVLVECKTGYGRQHNRRRGTLTLPAEFDHLRIKPSDQSRHLTQLLAEVAVVEHEMVIHVSEAYLIYCEEKAAEWIKLPDEWKERSLSLLLDLSSIR
jgi:hypothetical protein